MPAVLFDLDGVLIDSEGLQYESYSQVLARWGVAVSPQTYAEHWIAAGRGPEYAVKEFDLPVTPDALRDLKHPVYHEVLRRSVTLMPGAREALARLQPHFPIALATNSNRLDVDFVMDHFELRGFFTAILTREDYERAKPEPDAFLAAARGVGHPPQDCVVLEDAQKGIRAAAAAGIAAIAIPNQWTQANDFRQAARVVPTLDAVSVDLIHEVIQAARS